MTMQHVGLHLLQGIFLLYTPKTNTPRYQCTVQIDRIIFMTVQYMVTYPSITSAVYRILLKG